MPPSLLTIGEFSRLTRLSVRMLRYYDEHGVLHPTRVDPVTGYRFYDATLLEVARQVVALRDVGLGVSELAACVPLLDRPAALRPVLARQRARLVLDAVAASTRVDRLDHLLTTLEGTTMDITVTHRTDPAHLAASLRGVLPTYTDEGMLWQRLMSALGPAGAQVAPDARSVAVFHDQEYRDTDCDVEVRLTVAAPFTGTDDARCVEVPAQEVAVGLLAGPYEGMSEVMAAVGRWVPEHGLRFAGPMFNVYRVSPHEDPDPAHWLTEVCVPVTRAAG